MTMWILLAFVVSVVLGCPKDVMRGVIECMAPLEGYTVDQGSILELMSKPDKTSQMCKEGKIQTAFSCLNNLYNRCLLHRESSRRLELIIDVGKWSHAMNNICNNIHYLREHAECERLASLEYRPCAEAEMARVSDSLSVFWTPRATPTVVNQDHKLDAVMNILCYFSARIRDCLRTPFEKFCPAPLSKLLVNTVESIMPPACAKRALQNSTMGSHNYNHNGPYDEMEVIFGTPKGTKHSNRNTQFDEKIKDGRGTGNSGKKEAVKSRPLKNKGKNVSSQVKVMKMEITIFVLVFSYFMTK